MLSSDLSNAEAAIGIRTEKPEIPDEAPLPSSPGKFIPVPKGQDEVQNLQHVKVESLIALSASDFQQADTRDQLDMSVLRDFPSKSLSPENTDNFFNDALAAIISAREGELMMHMEQEKMDAVDGKARTSVPVLDFSIPEPAWRKACNTAVDVFKRMKDSDPKTFFFPLHPFHGEKDLRWIPFPKDLRREMQPETVAGIEKSRAALLDLLDRSFRQDESLKNPFLRNRDKQSLLSDLDDDDEELSLPGSEPEAVEEPEREKTPDLEALVKKRKREMDHEASVSVNPPPKKRKPGASLLFDKNTGNATEQLIAGLIKHRAPRKSTKSDYFGVTAPEVQDKPSSSTPSSDSPKHSQVKLTDAPARAYQIPSHQCRFIVCLELYTVMKLAKSIEEMWPGVELLDRDFAKHNSVLWSPGSTKRQPAVSNLSFEADIIVSPATGIIMTTMALVRQKPLPNSATLPRIRERVARVSRLYERLVVIVAESAFLQLSENEALHPPSASDMSALAEFVSFTMSLDAEVIVHYVGGGRQTLLSWVVGCMCDFSGESKATNRLLISEESSWESILREMGMNVFAAQVTLGVLGSGGENAGGTATNSLGKFLSRGWGLQERVTRLGAFLGGRRVLERTWEQICG